MFDGYCWSLSSDWYSVDYVIHEVVNNGYNKDEFLIYYQNHKSDIDEIRRYWRKVKWAKALKKIGATDDSNTLCFNVKELSYCTKYLTENEFDEIINELRYVCGVDHIKIAKEETNDRRHIAKALVSDDISERLEDAFDFYGGHISYKDKIETLFFRYPFLKKEQVIMFNYLESRGATIVGKPAHSFLPRQVNATYFTEEERLNALKESQNKYRSRKKEEQVNDLAKRVNIDRFVDWDDPSYDTDIQKHLRHKL